MSKGSPPKQGHRKRTIRNERSHECMSNGSTSSSGSLSSRNFSYKLVQAKWPAANANNPEQCLHVFIQVSSNSLLLRCHCRSLIGRPTSQRSASTEAVPKRPTATNLHETEKGVNCLKLGADGRIVKCLAAKFTTAFPSISFANLEGWLSIDSPFRRRSDTVPARPPLAPAPFGRPGGGPLHQNCCMIFTNRQFHARVCHKLRELPSCRVCRGRTLLCQEGCAEPLCTSRRTR